MKKIYELVTALISPYAVQISDILIGISFIFLVFFIVLTIYKTLKNRKPAHKPSSPSSPPVTQQAAQPQQKPT